MANQQPLPFSNSFLRRLSLARNLAYSLFRGIDSAAFSGPPSEFDGHRFYLPGDDPRWIDWNIEARLGELLLKVFQVEEEVDVVIMLDVSPSMNAGREEKKQTASAAAAALIYLALLTSHPVTLVRYSEKTIDRAGPYRSFSTYSSLLRRLRESSEGEKTDLRRSLMEVFPDRTQPTTLIVITDGFQPTPLEQATAAVKKLGRYRFLLFLIQDLQDLLPSLRGNLFVKDIEGPNQCRLIASKALEQQFHKRITDYFNHLAATVEKLGGEIVRFPVESSFEETFFNCLGYKDTRPSLTS